MEISYFSAYLVLIGIALTSWDSNSNFLRKSGEEKYMETISAGKKSHKSILKFYKRRYFAVCRDLLKKRYLSIIQIL